MNNLLAGSNGAMGAVPSYAQGDSGLGDLGGESFTRLTFKGSRFRITKGGDEQVLKETELDAIILAANPTVSRIYYAGVYNETDGTGERPSCASADGVRPLASVSQPQGEACETCPMNQKGSAISDDGGKRKACSYFHRLVVRLVQYPDLGEVVAEIKAMSLFGTSYPDQQLLNFRLYADRLNQHQTMAHAVVTRMSFDTDSSVPKLLFQPIAYVEEAEFAATIDPLAKSQNVLAMADTSSMRTGGDDGETTQGAQFREKLLTATAPAHAQLPPAEAPALTPEQAELAALQAQIAALENPAPAAPAAPVPVPEPEPEPVLSPEEQQIAALKAQIDALAPPVKIVEPVNPGIVNPMVNVHGVGWNPALHATSSETHGGVLNADGHWRARRGLSPEQQDQVKLPTTAPPAPVAVAVPAAKPAEVAAAVAAVPTADVPVAAAVPAAATEPTAFDADLDAALAEFDA